MMIEAPKELVDAVAAYKQRIDDAENELIRLRGERQELLDAEAAKLAEFKAGQKVRNNKHRYQITKITGWLYTFSAGSLSNLPPQLSIEYHGRLIKADGMLGEREKQIHDLRVDE